MNLNIYIFLIMVFLSSCSQYAIEEDKSGVISVYLKFQHNAGGEAFDFEYPVKIYAVDKTVSSITEFHYEEGEGIVASLAGGEYSINAFLGWNDEFINVNDITGRPMVAINGNSTSSYPLMAAHSSLNLEKQAELNFIPTYIVSSVEFEFINIPLEVKNIIVEISPTSCGYQIEGGFSDRTQGVVVECKNTNGIWASGQRFIFPAEGKKTDVNVKLDFGNEIKSYSYTFAGGLKQGQPYKFTGGFGEGLNMDGDFQISGWNMEEEVVIDFENESPLGGDESDDGPGDNTSDEEIFYVNSIPSDKVIWGPFYLWKVEETGVDEAQAVIISPDQWFQIYEDGEALEILNGYEIDGISGWRTFTRNEAEEFYKELSTELDELNPYLQENGHNIFYTENRYLCENCEYAFNIYGETNIRPAGTTVKYYLRPVKTICLRVKN